MEYEDFICPITRQIMNNPGIASDGHTYETRAIQTYLKNNNKSPITRLIISNCITPNY